MAYSPSPQPATLPTGGNAAQIIRLSATPPFQHVISKRDKRRIVLSDRLSEISTQFAQNRDAVYRSQMQVLQLDMNFINNANLYENMPLEDFGDDIIRGLSSNIPGSAAGARSTQGGARMSDIEAPPGAGKWAAMFTKEINDAFEEKDSQLTLLADRYNYSISLLKEDYSYSTLVAKLENEKLAEQIRDRVVQSVAGKKANLLKEKERLDIGDTNALLNHPYQFNVVHPASPGGTLSNRKTRHTRHRLEMDDFGSTADSNKRKRKAAADTDFGSPGPATRGPVPDPIVVKESQTQREANQAASSLLSINDLFSEKELNQHLQVASKTAVDSITSKRRRISEESQGTVAFTHSNASDASDDVADTSSGAAANGLDTEREAASLAAPEMDRTANSSFHATRSTRTTTVTTPLSSFESPSDLVGRASAIPLIGTYIRDRKKEDDALRTAPLTEQERDADLAAMAAAMAEEEKLPGSMNKKAKKELCPTVIDYVSAAIQSQDDFATPFNNPKAK